MLDVKVDVSQLQRLKKEFPDRVRKAQQSVLKSISFKLSRTMREEAFGLQDKPAPLTRALRRQPIGKFLSRFMGYRVLPGGLASRVGIVEGAKVSRSLATLAKASASGFAIRVTRQAQRRLASKLREKHKVITARRAWGQVGGLGSYLPRVGRHTARARPIVSVVYGRERQRIIDEARRMFAIKMKGGRY